jgi:acid phosphatase type 7
MSEYIDKFFPIYNAGDPSPTTGAPLLRSRPFLVAPGNHDLLERDLDQVPDAQAYFLVWSLPLNGPKVEVGAIGTPSLRGTEARQRAFLERAGPAYPRMANYAFDYGDVHWTVLDTNPYADWSDPALRDWLERDLASAKDVPWRFVAFHQPPFQSARTHSDEQRTRLLAPVFEQYHVDIVFTGHVHNYQRSYPLRFVPVKAANGRAIDPEGRVGGRWTLDRAFDGKSRTRPDGVIYLVTGAGGARLYNRDQNDDAASWQEFTAKFVSNVHSLTIVDVDAAKVFVRQVSDEGEELDRFIVTK